MKKHLIFLIFISALFFSCKDDSPTGSTGGPGTGSSSFTGEWTVDKVQLVQAPTGGSFSALMKQALQPFGEIDASFAGYLDFNFGGEVLNITPTNIGNIQGEIVFNGNTGFYLPAIYSTNVLKISSDGGYNWNPIAISFSYSQPRFFVNPTNVIYMMYNNSGTNYLAKSTDIGSSWTNTQIDQGNANTFAFTTDQVGYAISNENIYKTTNSGQNWFEIYKHIYIYDIKCFDEQNVVVYTYQNGLKILKTSNGGVSWNEYVVNSSTSYTSWGRWYWQNSNVGWISTYSFSGNELFKTIDGGQTWNKISDFGAFEIKFLNGNEGYAHSGDFLFKTTNAGVNWINNCFTSEEINLQSLQVINGSLTIFTHSGNLLKLNGTIDTTKWLANGMVTNTAIRSITHAPSHEIFATGDFTTSSNSITFRSLNYSGNSSDQGTGSGTYSFESGFLYITLDLPNSEKWKFKLRKK